MYQKVSESSEIGKNQGFYALQLIFHLSIIYASVFSAYHSFSSHIANFLYVVAGSG